MMSFLNFEWEHVPRTSRILGCGFKHILYRICCNLGYRKREHIPERRIDPREERIGGRNGTNVEIVDGTSRFKILRRRIERLLSSCTLPISRRTQGARFRIFVYVTQAKYYVSNGPPPPPPSLHSFQRHFVRILIRF